MDDVTTPQTLDRTQTAELDAGVGNSKAHVKVQMTPTGLLAIGGLVGCILLAVSTVVWTATSVKRKHPIASALGRR